MGDDAVKDAVKEPLEQGRDAAVRGHLRTRVVHTWRWVVEQAQAHRALLDPNGGRNR